MHWHRIKHLLVWTPFTTGQDSEITKYVSTSSLYGTAANENSMTVRLYNVQQAGFNRCKYVRECITGAGTVLSQCTAAICVVRLFGESIVPVN